MASFLKEEIKAGVIIVVSFVLLSGSVVLIGGTQFFEKLDPYYMKVMNVAGIEEGAPVRLGGVRVGKVLKVQVPSSPGEPITITLGVKKGTVLYKGTKASIAQVGFVGDLYILLSLDKTTSERYRSGDMIPAEEQVPFSVLMARLDSISLTADGLLKDLGSLFSDTNKKEVGNILKNTNAAIVSGSSNIDNVLHSLNRTNEDFRDVLHEVKNKPWSVVYKEGKGKEE